MSDVRAHETRVGGIFEIRMQGVALWNAILMVASEVALDAWSETSWPDALLKHAFLSPLCAAMHSTVDVCVCVCVRK